MARKKKSRKVGQIGVRKDPNYKPTPKAPSAKRKPSKGKPAGSRHNVETEKKSTTRSSTKADPRKGSKKPIPLVVSPASVVKARKFATPADELAYIEADQRLQSLLDNLEQGQSLNAEQQAYVDEKMSRHKVLCELLGITQDLDDEDDDSDPFANLDAINLDDYKE